MNIGFEICYRFTGTDYLDDVSKTYVGADKFPKLPDGTTSVAGLLQDRSYETGTPVIGIEGRQRGYSNQKDGYVIAELTLTINLLPIIAPVPNSNQQIAVPKDFAGPRCLKFYTFVPLKTALWVH